MKQILKECTEFYSMLEYFNTKNEDDSTKLPTIMSKPFAEFNGIDSKVKDIIDNKYFVEVPVECKFISK